MKILYIAPLKDYSGYACAARNYVRALDSVGCDLVTRNLRYDGGDYQFNEREKYLASRPIQDIDVIISETTPNESSRRKDIFSVHYFAWETDRIPIEWVNSLNLMDLVLVPCEENLRACRRSGVLVPIEVVHHTFDVESYRPQKPFDLGPQFNKHFKILSICQVSKKKGLDSLLRAYFAEFTKEDKTLLMLKFYFGSKDTDEHRQVMFNQISKVRELMRLKDYPPVYIIHGVTSDESISRLYSTADCYALTSRGEGWGIPYFDAMAYGLPPIATNWGGPREFITPQCGWLVDCSMTPCFDMQHPHDFMYTAKDNWAEPSIDSSRKALRQAWSEWSAWKNADGEVKQNTLWNKRKLACVERVGDFNYSIVGGRMKNLIENYYNKWKAARG